MVSRRIRTPLLLAAGSSLLVCGLIACDMNEDDPGADAGPAGDSDAGPPESDAGATGDTDAGPRSDAGPPGDAGPPHDGRIAAFVAHGYAGRTTISCDDGRTWVADQSDDDSIRCFDGVDCDHHPGRAKGIVYDGEYFVATYGWGPPGGVRRSRDGVDWEVVLEGTTFGGLAIDPGTGRILAGGRSSRWTDDAGGSWSGDVDVGLGGGYNVRRAGYGGGVFVLAGNDASELVISADATEGSWGPPDAIPAECGANIQNDGGIAYGGGALVVLGGDGVACRSTDGGRTFTSTDLGASIGSHLLWDGAQFIAWSNGQVHRSPDGASWSAEGTSPGVSLGAVGYNPETGTYVGVRGGWNQWYERQELYRSADGTTWETLGDGAFEGGHPIFGITFGRVLPSEECPLI